VQLQAKSKRFRDFAYCLNERPAGAIQRVPQHGGACGMRYQVVEQFHQFPPIVRGSIVAGVMSR
jgi:hypothetical protein